ncbi:hypothetical protein CYMTET_42812, partial [Cymbomonas tetramitiformis]
AWRKRLDHEITIGSCFLATAYWIAWRHPRRLLLMCICIVAQGLCTLTLPKLLQNVLDKALTLSIQELNFFIILYMLVAVLNVGAKQVLDTLTPAGGTFQADIKHCLVLHMLDLPQAEIDKLDTSKVLTSIERDVEVLDTNIHAFVECISSTMMLAVLLTLLFQTSLGLSVVLLSISPIVAAFATVRSKRVRRAAETQKEDYSDFFAHAGEILANTSTIRVMGMTPFFQASMQEHAKALSTSSRFLKRVTLNTSGGLKFLEAVMNSAVLGLGVVWYVNERITAGELVMFYTSTRSLMGLYVETTRSFTHFFSSAVSLGNVRAIIAVNAVEWVDEGSLKLNCFDITLRNVGLSYSNLGRELGPIDPTASVEEPPVSRQGSLLRRSIGASSTSTASVIQLVSVDIKEGQKVVIIGKSGSGKTSMLKLLCRVYQPSQGVILYGKQPINSVDVPQITSMLEQDVRLFRGSMRYNMTAGASDITDEEVLEMAEMVLLDASGSSGNPLNDTGDVSQTLSTGVQQRLCLARTLLRGTPIVFLDEPTAMQDHTTADRLLNDTLLNHEYTVQGEDGSKTKKPATVVMVSNRLECLTDWDKIIHIGDGTVLEIGSPKDLIRERGPYWRMMERRKGLRINSRGDASVLPTFLSHIWLFASTHLNMLDDICGRFVSRKFSAGETIFRAGDPGCFLYILASGKVEETRRNSDGVDIIVQTFEDGDSFGEEALYSEFTDTLADDLHSTTASCERSCVVVMLSKEHFKAELDCEPQMKEKVLEVVAAVDQLKEAWRMRLIWPFLSLPQPAIDMLTASMRVITYQRGYRLVTPTVKCRALHLLVLGKVCVSKREVSSGSAVSTFIVRPGGYFGERVALSGCHHDEEIEEALCTERCTCLTLSQQHIDLLIRGHPQYSVALNSVTNMFKELTSVAFLQEHWLFSNFSEPCLQKLRRCFTPCAFHQTAMVLNSNENFTECTLVMRGDVRMTTVLGSGASARTRHQEFQSGAFLNLRGLLLGGSSPEATLARSETHVTARAVTPVVVLRCQQDAVLDVLDDFNEKSVLWALSSAWLKYTAREFVWEQLSSVSDLGTDKLDCLIWNLHTIAMSEGESLESHSQEPYIAIVVHGSLQCKTASGGMVTAPPGAFVWSTAAAEQFRLQPNTMHMRCTVAAAASTPCIVAKLDLERLHQDTMLSARQAEEQHRLQAAKDAVLVQSKEALRVQIKKLEIRLGLVTWIHPAKRWKKTKARFQAMKCFNLLAALTNGSRNPGSTMSNHTISEEVIKEMEKSKHQLEVRVETRLLQLEQLREEYSRLELLEIFAEKMPGLDSRFTSDVSEEAIRQLQEDLEGCLSAVNVELTGANEEVEEAWKTLHIMEGERKLFRLKLRAMTIGRQLRTLRTEMARVHGLLEPLVLAKIASLHEYYERLGVRPEKRVTVLEADERPTIATLRKADDAILHMKQVEAIAVDAVSDSARDILLSQMEGLRRTIGDGWMTELEFSAWMEAHHGGSTRDLHAAVNVQLAAMAGRMAAAEERVMVPRADVELQTEDVESSSSEDESEEEDAEEDERRAEMERQRRDRDRIQREARKKQQALLQQAEVLDGELQRLLPKEAGVDMLWDWRSAMQNASNPLEETEHQVQRLQATLLETRRKVHQRLNRDIEQLWQLLPGFTPHDLRNFQVTVVNPSAKNPSKGDLAQMLKKYNMLVHNQALRKVLAETHLVKLLWDAMGSSEVQTSTSVASLSDQERLDIQGIANRMHALLEEFSDEYQARPLRIACPLLPHPQGL